MTSQADAARLRLHGQFEDQREPCCNDPLVCRHEYSRRCDVKHFDITLDAYGAVMRLEGEIAALRTLLAWGTGHKSKASNPAISQLADAEERLAKLEVRE